jgi:hypothetical protein
LILPHFRRCLAFYTKFFGIINFNFLQLIIHQHCECELRSQSFLRFNSYVSFKLIRNHFANV